MLTEAEAKTKWCPFVRTGLGAHNRWSTGDNPLGLVGCECVASACMQWRWAAGTYRKKRYATDRRATVEPSRPSDVPPSWEWAPFDPEDGETESGWREPQSEAGARRTGYCGLAGAATP